MKKMCLALGLMVAACMLLTGCVQLASEEEQGGIRITIPPRANFTTAATPRMIPANAEFIRVRICSHPSAGDFNMVVTLPLLPGGSSTDVSVPVGVNYGVFAISYLVSEGVNYALTHDGTYGVSILANEVTPVVLNLRPWSYSITGFIPWNATGDEPDEMTAASGEEYSAYVQIDSGLGKPNALMYASLTSFQDVATPFPGDGVQWDSGQNYTFWEFRDNVAPSIGPDDEPTPLYVAFLFRTSAAEWSDTSDPSRITLCIPNRYLGEPLHQIMITPPPPPAGSVDLVIQ